MLPPRVRLRVLPGGFSGKGLYRSLWLIVGRMVAVSCGPQQYSLSPAHRADAVGRQLQCGVRWRQAPRSWVRRPAPRAPGGPRTPPTTGMDAESLESHAPTRAHGHRAPLATRRAGHLTLGVRRGGQRERGTSGRWKPSAPRPCSAKMPGLLSRALPRPPAFSPAECPEETPGP